MRQQCVLELSATRESFQGELIGAPFFSSGELVFTTGMVGYCEAMTDPSYFGQILIFTYPLIGNYGIPTAPQTLKAPLARGFESAKAQAAGVIIAIDSPESYHWNSLQNLDQWLRQQNIPGIVGLDTRHLVQLIRGRSDRLARIQPQQPEGEKNFGKLRIAAGDVFDPGAHCIIDEVSVKERIRLGKGSRKIAVIDCGVKWNILRQLQELSCEIELIPWNDDFTTVDCDAWLISNGPGDPQRTGSLKEKIQHLMRESRPILGICLGHQLLALAAGATTSRMVYGHRSHNQPVYEVGTRRGYISSQNHGYVVDDQSLPDEWQAWFRNANDQTIEGIRHQSRPFRSVQFHPEAAGGPRDTGWILEQFIAEVHR